MAATSNGNFSGSPTLAIRKQTDRNGRGHQPAGIPVDAASSRAAPQFPSLAFVALLALASGCAALVFQVTWMRELRLVFGATTASVAAVLAIFMAGLGIGSAVLGKWADRAANPLYLYGALEVVIALSTAVTPWLIGLASAIYLGMGGQETLGVFGATIVRLALTAAVMAVPTFLMGGTLPAAVRAVTRPNDLHRRALGVLYGANTLGAVFGSFVATFFALETLGTRATLWAGCAIGLLAGVLAVARSRALAPSPAQGGSAARKRAQEVVVIDQPKEITSAPDRPPILLYLTAAVLGFTFFALELVWYRMLAPILGGTAFTFGLILCIALLGIGVGGLAYNFVFRRLEPTWSALAVTCGLEAAFTMLPFALGDRLALLASWESQAATNFTQLVFGWGYVTAIVVLPVALIAGLQFPLLTALLGQGRETVSRHLGMTYAWNTLGAITGSLVAGFGAMPLLGALGLWQAIGLILAALSVVLLLSGPRASRGAVAVVAGLLLMTVGSLFALGPTAAWRHGGIGAGRSLAPPYTQRNLIQRWLNEKRHVTIWETDGIESSVAIDGLDGLAFVVNGKVDGNSLDDAGTQMGAAALAAVLHKDPRTGLVIGLGTGESAGWLASMRNMEHVDVVELEPAIDEMATRCRELNCNVLNHPRVRRIHNDGREHVLTTRDKYDVIFSEPSNPYRAGIAALYTTEFYQAASARLNPGGIFMQWLQAYEIDEATVITVLATAGSEFKHVEVWQTLAMDMQLVCSNEPLAYSVAELRERISSGAVKEVLEKAWKVNDVEGFLSHFVANSQWANEVAESPIVVRNTDDRTILEYSFAKSVGREVPFAVEEVRNRVRAKGFHRPPLGDAVDWRQVELRRQEFNLLTQGMMSTVLFTDTADQQLIEAFSQYLQGHYQAALDVWPAAYRRPSSDIQRIVLAACYAELGRPEYLELLTAVESRFPIDVAAVRAIYFWRAKDTAKSAEALGQYFDELSKSPWRLPFVSDTIFMRTVDVAKADPEAARRLVGHLSKPFAAFRSNYLREITRVVVAAQVGSQEVVEALVDLEPHVPWRANILEPRAKAYAELKHPLAAQAERDWQWFQDHQLKSVAESPL